MDSSLDSLNVSLSHILDNEDGSDYNLQKIHQNLADNSEKAYQIRKQEILNLIQPNNLQKNSHCFKFNVLSKPQDCSQISKILPLSSTKPTKQNSYRSLNPSRVASPQSKLTSSQSKLTSPSHTDSRNSSIHSGRTRNRSNSPSVKAIDLQKVSAHNVTCLSKRSQVKILQRKEKTKDITRLKESFYNRAVKWKETQIVKAEKQKEMQEMSQLKECTFTPTIIKGQSKTDISNSSLYYRNFIWKENIRQSNEYLKEIQNEKELEVCTFQPITNASIETIKIDPLSTYKRNLEWKTQIQKKLRQSKELSRPTSTKRSVPLPPKCQTPLSFSRNDSDTSLNIEKELMDIRYIQLTDMLDSISQQIEACISKDSNL